MAAKFLVEREIESGGQLLRKLDEQGVNVKAAFWNYDPEAESYKLVIGCPEVDQTGARPVYRQIQQALEALPERDRVPFSEIAVTSLSTSMVSAIGRAVSTAPGAIESHRITNTVANRELIEDAYVYRMSLTEHSPDSGVLGANR